MSWILALLALLCGMALLFDIPLGALTPHLAGIGITLLALAVLIGDRSWTWIRPFRGPATGPASRG